MRPPIQDRMHVECMQGQFGEMMGPLVGLVFEPLSRVLVRMES